MRPAYDIGHGHLSAGLRVNWRPPAFGLLAVGGERADRCKMGARATTVLRIRCAVQPETAFTFVRSVARTIGSNRIRLKSAVEAAPCPIRECSRAVWGRQQRLCGCDSSVGTYEEVGFVRRKKGSMHLQSRANVPATARGGHDCPSLSWRRAPHASADGYGRSVPPHVRGRVRKLTSIRFRYAYGKVQTR